MSAPLSDERLESFRRTAETGMEYELLAEVDRLRALMVDMRDEWALRANRYKAATRSGDGVVAANAALHLMNDILADGRPKGGWCKDEEAVLRAQRGDES